MKPNPRLSAFVSTVYERNKDRDSYSPTWMATEAMQAIDFPRWLHDDGYDGCHCYFREIARGFLRRNCEPPADDDLFNGLQARYPIETPRGEEPVYVLRELLTDTQVAQNVDRLRRSGRARLKHADALEAWGRTRTATQAA